MQDFLDARWTHRNRRNKANIIGVIFFVDLESNKKRKEIGHSRSVCFLSALGQNDRDIKEWRISLQWLVGQFTRDETWPTRGQIEVERGVEFWVLWVFSSFPNFGMLGLTSPRLISSHAKLFLFNLVWKKILNFPLENDLKPIYTNSYESLILVLEK